MNLDLVFVEHQRNKKLGVSCFSNKTLSILLHKLPTDIYTIIISFYPKIEYYDKKWYYPKKHIQDLENKLFTKLSNCIPRNLFKENKLVYRIISTTEIIHYEKKKYKLMFDIISHQYKNQQKIGETCRTYWSSDESKVPYHNY